MNATTPSFYGPLATYVPSDCIQPGDWVTVRIARKPKKDRYLAKCQVTEVHGNVLRLLSEKGERTACMVYDVRKAWRTDK